MMKFFLKWSSSQETVEGRSYELTTSSVVGPVMVPMMEFSPKLLSSWERLRRRKVLAMVLRMQSLPRRNKSTSSAVRPLAMQPQMESLLKLLSLLEMFVVVVAPRILKMSSLREIAERMRYQVTISSVVVGVTA